MAPMIPPTIAPTGPPTKNPTVMKPGIVKSTIFTVC